MTILDLLIFLSGLGLGCLLSAWLMKSKSVQTDSSAYKLELLGNNPVILEGIHKTSEKTLERLHQHQTQQTQTLQSFKDDLKTGMQENFEKLQLTVENRLEKISQKVQENLTAGFDKTNHAFTELIARLAKIDEAQKKIESLSLNVVSLQDVLTDKKSRGIFGEVQLKNLLENVFGENQKNVFSLQTKLSNDTIVDALLHLPDPIGKVGVDSKFPLENFKRMVDRTHTDEARLKFAKDFVSDFKKHIDAIADKYILKNETSDQAILFLPAEAIFAEVHAYHHEIVDYAHKKRVWISSPTTFMATLTSLQTVLMNMERSKYMSIIHQEMNLLGQDFERFEGRWNNLAKHIETVSKDVSQIHTSSQKISGRFKKILDVEIKPDEIEL